MHKPSDRTCFVLYGVFMLVWLFLNIPPPRAFPLEVDMAHQLAGAQQILFGEHPFVDYRSSYGPLVFYMSALGQALSGQRILGEMLLAMIGYGISFSLLYLLVKRVAPNRWSHLGLIVLATLALPRLHKYYVFLGPILTLWCAWHFVERPDRRRLALLGAATAFAGLLRQDLGVFCFLCGLSALWKHPRRIPAYCVWVVAAAAPYLVFVASLGGLPEYLGDSVRVSLSKASGLALPFPAFHWSSPLLSPANELSWLYSFFFAQPVIALVVFLRAWKSLDEGERTIWISTLVLASLCLIQATHRADTQHLLQAIPLSFVLIALTLRDFPPGGSVRLALYAWAPLLAISTVLLIRVAPWPALSDGVGHASKVAVYMKSKDGFLDHLAGRPPVNWSITLGRAIRSCTAPEERILVYPFYPVLYYLTGRRFAAGQMLTAPGYYDTPADQLRAIEIFERQDVALLISSPQLSFDPEGVTTIDRTHPILWEHVRRAFRPIGKLGVQEVSVRTTAPDSLASCIRQGSR